MDNADPKARREILSAPTCWAQYVCPPTPSGVSPAPKWSPTFSCYAAAKLTGLSTAALTTGYTAPLTVAADDGTDTEIDINSLLPRPSRERPGRPSLGHGIHGHQTLNVTADESSPLALQVGHRLRTIIDTARNRGQGLTATAASLTEVSDVSFDPGLITAVTTRLPARDTLRFDEATDEFQTWTGDTWATAKVFNTRKQETIHLLKLRDVANAVVSSQRAGQPSEVREQLRGELNRLYDTYVAKHGPIQRFKWSKPSIITQDRHDKSFAKSIERWRQKNPEQHTVPAELLEAWDEQAWETPASTRCARTSSPPCATIPAGPQCWRWRATTNSPGRRARHPSSR